MTAMTDVAKEYGAALFLLACEENAKKEYSEALAVMKETFSETPEYLDFLDSPSIAVGERLAAIEAAFCDRVPEHVLSFLLL